MTDLDLAYDALAAVIFDDAAMAEFPADALNLVSAHQYALNKDCPGKTWWHAEAAHPAIFRALRMDRAEVGAVFAAAAFRLHRSEVGARILCAFPAPKVISDPAEDWLGIETVLSWDPVTDTAEVLGEGPALVGSIPDGDTLAIHGSPFAFLRALAEARAQWFVGWTCIQGDWRRRPIEPDLSPGLLLIGAPDKVRWPLRQMPKTIHCAGVDAKALNRAMIRQARVPHASSSELRRAA